MSDRFDEATDDQARVRLAWEVPEIAVVAILLAVAVLIVAGVVSGIVIGTSTAEPGVSIVALGAQFATTWAGVFTSVLLLGAIGVCWWQHKTWRAPEGNHEDRLADWAGRLWRVRRLAFLVLAELLLTTLGSIASLVGRLDSIPSAGGAQTVATVWLPGIAEILGSLVVGLAGLWIGSRLIGDPDLQNMDRFNEQADA